MIITLDTKIQIVLGTKDHFVQDGKTLCGLSLEEAQNSSCRIIINGKKTENLILSNIYLQGLNQSRRVFCQDCLEIVQSKQSYKCFLNKQTSKCYYNDKTYLGLKVT